MTGRYIGMDGEPCSGTVTFTPPCIVRDNNGQAIISGPITADLDFMGYLDVEVPCTLQDGMDPTGWTYEVTERLDCADCITQYRTSVACDGDTPTPIPAAAAVCVGDGYTVGVAVENAIYPVNVNWGDGTAPESFGKGQIISHRYWQEGDPLDPTRPVSAVWPAPVVGSQGSAFQQTDTDPETGDWYLTEVISGGQALEGETSQPTWTQRRCSGDMAISRLDADGNLISHMYARKFDHGAGFSVQRDGDTLYMWTGTDAQDCSEGDGKVGYATKVGRFPYVAGQVLDVGDPGLEIFDPFPNYTNFTPHVDVTHQTIALRYYLQEEPGQPRNKFTVWTLEDFLARDYSNPLYDLEAPYHPDGQSWTHYGGYIYSYYGGTNKPQFFYILDLATGEETGPIPNTQQQTWAGPEAEAIMVRETGEGPEVVWGMAVRPQGSTVSVLYATGPHRAEQDVTITVTDAAGTVVNATGIDHIPCTPSR
ncbi:hypothetical protein ACIRLA_46375 [Streptomyces sp. NPDC102364]|uniref:phage baseplate protein n=1 Tax=Streptomyces sp. NPDC102364 TaxID=3366161 RepID=UPI0038199DA4